MTTNRTIVAVICVLGAVLLIGGVLGSAKKQQQKPPVSFFQGTGSYRAVVVSTDQPRTVVVTPCNAPAPDVRAGARRQMSVPGVTTLRLVPGSGRRTVLIPRCAAEKGTTLNGGANLPSAAFVLRPGQRPPTVQPQPSPMGVQSQLTVPDASRVTTIVVPPCRAGSGPIGGEQQQIVLNPSGTAPGTAVAPNC